MDNLDRYCQHDLSYQSIANGTNIQLVVLGNDQWDPEHLNCVAKDDLSAFIRWTETIRNNPFEDEMLLVPHYREICLAKLDGFGFVRCKYMGWIRDGLFLMFSIDYGSMFWIEAANIRVRNRSSRTLLCSVQLYVYFLFISQTIPGWVVKTPVFVMHVTGFSPEQTMNCIIEKRCLAKKLVAQINEQGFITHKIEL